MNTNLDWIWIFTKFCTFPSIDFIHCESCWNSAGNTIFSKAVLTKKKERIFRCFSTKIITISRWLRETESSVNSFFHFLTVDFTFCGAIVDVSIIPDASVTVEGKIVSSDSEKSAQAASNCSTTSPWATRNDLTKEIAIDCYFELYLFAIDWIAPCTCLDFHTFLRIHICQDPVLRKMLSKQSWVHHILYSNPGLRAAKRQNWLINVIRAPLFSINQSYFYWCSLRLQSDSQEQNNKFCPICRHFSMFCTIFQIKCLEVYELSEDLNRTGANNNISAYIYSGVIINRVCVKED